ncbi:MAG: hypothetical protein BWY79_01949 [Actinobacteria bacterium ADurb.Bin444]|nr:MAG: hypothetical protein BWY79_01949 [Actinobacteria bacterium ADurb.Bin444]
MPVGNGYGHHLYRSQPGREGPAVVLDDDAEEALDRTQNGAVQHDRPVALVVFTDVLQLEAVGHGEVELAGGALPGATHHILDMEVDLGPIEGTVAGVQLILEPQPLQRLRECGLRPLPHLRGADRFIGPRGELHVDFFEPEGPVHAPHQFDDPHHFVFHLLR